jgi:hypothetical protein
MMLNWLPAVLRDAGLHVREVPGWQGRGRGRMGEPLGVLAHHTAGPASGDGRLGDLVVPDYPSLGTVVNGRPRLAGPLANVGLARDGTWIVIAAGRANHSGAGSAPWCPAGQGNRRLIGIEAESVGTRDDWTDEQRESYPRGVATLLRHLGLPAARVIGHKEWAPRRKIDPAFWDMNEFRAAVARWMIEAQEDDMPSLDEIRAVVRAELAAIARRDDVGHARSQVLTALGVDDPVGAPAAGGPSELEAKIDELLRLLRAATPASVPSGPVALVGGRPPGQ